MAEKRFFTDIILGTDNLLITAGSGSPESNQTADVGSLYIQNDSTDAGDAIYVKNSGTGNTGWLQVASMPSGGTTGDILFVGPDGNLQHDGTTDFVWDSSNNRLGVNVASPISAIHVFDNGATTSRLAFETTSTANAPGLQFQWDSAGTRRALIRGIASNGLAVQGGTNPTELQFYTRDSGGTLNQNMILDEDGHLNINDGNELRLWNSTGWTGGDYIGLSASGASATITYILPNAVGSSGQYLELDNSGTGQLVWSTPAGGGGGGAETLDELLDVEVSSADDGDLLIFEAGSLNAWRATSAVSSSRIISPHTPSSSVRYPLVTVNGQERNLTDHGRDESQCHMYTGQPGEKSGGQLIIGANQTISGVSMTGSNLNGSALFQELGGGFIVWQSYGVGGTLDSPTAVADSSGGFAVYPDSDGTGQAQAYGYFQASGHNGSSYVSSCVLGAFYDKDGPAVGDATNGLPGKWVLCTSNGIDETFPRPALSIFSDKTVEVVRGNFRIRTGKQIQLYNGDNDSYVALQAPDNISSGSDNILVLELPGDPGDNGQVLTTDGTGVLNWTTASGGGSGESVQFDLNQSSPTLAVLDSVYHDGTDWQKAQADDPDTLGTHIVLSKSGDDYEICQAGRVTVTSHGLTIGEYYFTSDATPGLLTSTEPTDNYSNPMVYAEDANTIHVLPYRPSFFLDPTPTPLIKGVGVESPTSSEDITLFFTDDAITITQLNAVLRGSSTPSVTWTIRHDTDRSATGTEVVTSGTTTTSITSGSEVTSFNDATIPGGSWVWFETTAQSGTVDEINVAIEYTRDE